MPIKKVSQPKKKRKINIGDLVELYNEDAFGRDPVGKIIKDSMDSHLRVLITAYKDELTKLAEAQEANGEIVYTPIYYGRGSNGVRKAIAEMKEASAEDQKRLIGFNREE